MPTSADAPPVREEGEGEEAVEQSVDAGEKQPADAQGLAGEEAAPEEPSTESESAAAAPEPSERQGSDGGSETAERPKSEEGARSKPTRTRQSFSWRQVSVLEQVFEQDPLPRQVQLARQLAPYPMRPRRGRALDACPLPAGAPPSPALRPADVLAAASRRRSSACNSRSASASHPAACRSGSRTGGRNGRRSSSRWASHPPRSSPPRVA